jgi:hypothetical protein
MNIRDEQRKMKEKAQKLNSDSRLKRAMKVESFVAAKIIAVARWK